LVEVFPKPIHGIIDEIKVRLFKNGEKVTVRFETGSRSQFYVRLGSFLALFVGGYFTSKGLRSQDKIEEVRRDFWLYLSDKIEKMVSSRVGS